MLPRRAQILIGATIAAAGALTLAGIVKQTGADVDVRLLLVVVALCAAANLFEVFAPGHYSLQPNFAFFFFAAVLLPPWAIAVTAICCFLPGWAAKRFPWFKVAFNIANYVVAGCAAHGIVRVADVFEGPGPPGPSGVVALAVAALAFAFVNHLLIVFVASYASGEPLRTGLHQLMDGLPLDVPLAGTGACLAVLWDTTPAAALLALGPLALIYRALLVPQLEQRARTDAKTGLYNFGHFGERFEEALADARRRSGSLGVVVVDLDHLREINNRFGHLVGDRVIRAVAEAVGDTGEPYATAARFGGEEFCLLLPGASVERAERCAEALRLRVAALRFREQDTERPGAPAKVTLSAGIAVFPDHGEDAEELLASADLALYEAKAAGRNRVRVALSPDSRAALELSEAPASAGVVGPAAAGWAATGAPFPWPAGAPPAASPSSSSADAPPAGQPSSSPADAAPTGIERRGAGPAEPERPPDAAPPGVREAPAPPVGARQLLPVYALVVTAAALLVAMLSGTSAAERTPLLLLALVVCVVVLDFVDLDLFGRGRVSPGAIPSLALAFHFGPIGPLAAELTIWALRLARRESLLKTSFNFGSLALSGAAAAGVFALTPSGGAAALVAAGTVAGLAYYAVNATLVAGAWSLDEGVAPLAAWRERFAWCWPYHVAFGGLAGTFLVVYGDVGWLAFALLGLPVAMLWLAQKQYLDRTRQSVAELRSRHEEATEANRRLTRLLEDKHELLRQVHRSYLATITSLARTIEAKDPYTGGHTERVAEVALLIAAELGFDEAEKRGVAVGSVIHDIGKLGIPDEILLKPGRLSPEELAIVRRHPEISTYILAELELPPMVKQMVRHHHERFDGGGYPDGLAGEDIPLAARVLAVADALDAMTSNRPYRGGRPLSEARAEITSQAGTQFCPRVVAALNATFEGAPEFWERFEREQHGQEAPSAPVAV